MKEIDINLNSPDVINCFLNDVSKFKKGLFIQAGRDLINAGSPISLFVCDLSKPIKVMIYSDEKDILQVLERYIIA